MSSNYVVLDNRPVDQWKVTELKEELKRRKLVTKGLKEDLVRRLDAAVRNEMESAKEKLENDVVNPDLISLVVPNEDKIHEQTVDGAGGSIASNIEKPKDDVSMVDIDINTADIDQETKVQELESSGDMHTNKVAVDATENVVSIETSAVDNQGVLNQEEFSREKESTNDDMQGEDEKTSKASPSEDVKPNISDDPNDNQVSEVSPVLATHSVSINEKNELKDNLNADNFHLELENVKPDKVVQELSSNEAPSVGDDLLPLDDDQEPGGNQASAEMTDDMNVSNVNCSKKNDGADGGFLEKLNLDRSSGDDSLEEDVMDSKQTDSNHNSDGAVDKIEIGESPALKVDNSVDVVSESVSEKKNVLGEKNSQGIASEKRKLEDKETVVNNDPVKRQRRWSSETSKISESPNSSQTPSSTPRDIFPKRTFNRSDSTNSRDTPKERVVPPLQKPATNSLRIDRFLRPFTLKAVQELLAKTGTVTDFWMDHIKTHCYVTYSSVEEAVETRNALYNLQWPPNGGRLLVAEFVDAQEVKARLEAPPPSPAPISTPTTPTPVAPIQPSPRQNAVRQHLPPPPPLPPPPTLETPPAREKVILPPPPPKKPDPPIVTLDDLFRKTKATPRIYYLPLSEEQVAAKLAAQGRK
ncbi:actin cytoskeleton-regulatory complex protein PAN1 [Aristolochia californica]|uniref:actin cytoskeleton-regulatory complex protein PAN1 n=1 Tax=Aristolochia californica TaxID=171875 RepID=UPI0035DAE46C